MDPAKGLSAAVTLKPRVPVEDTTRVVRGRVVNLQGHALRDAVVEQQGAFLAAKLFTEATGADRKTMAVAEGATVRGRLLYQGKPVSSAEVGLVTHNTRAGTSYPETRIGTQEDGTFAITNVPAGRIWTAYPKMESLAARGLAGVPVELETKDNGEDVNIGDIELTVAHKLTGHLIFADGKPVPPGMRVLLNADRARDSQTAVLPPDGSFEFKGLATGVYSLDLAVRGYELTEGFEQECW